MPTQSLAVAAANGRFQDCDNLSRHFAYHRTMDIDQRKTRMGLRESGRSSSTRKNMSPERRCRRIADWAFAIRLRVTEDRQANLRNRLTISLAVVCLPTSIPCALAILSRFSVTANGIPPLSILASSSRASADRVRLVKANKSEAFIRGSCVGSTRLISCRVCGMNTLDSSYHLTAHRSWGVKVSCLSLL
jgi:hypothetical protein